MKKAILFLSLIALTLPFCSSAQDDSEAPELSISGSIDAYYRVNLNNSNDETSGATMSPGSSFANQPGFALGMANIILGLDGEKSGFVADLAIGPKGDEAVFNAVNADGNPANSAIINQLYAYWHVGESVTLSFGNFNTFLGYEVISPTGNFNYSTSYMFSNGPFSHSGLKADFDMGNGWSLMTGIFNPTDFTDFNPTAEYMGGLQLGYSADAGSFYFNSLFDDDFYQFDITTGWDLSDSFYLGVNTTYAKDSFYGIAGYFQLATSETFGLGLRTEYFADEGLGLVGDGETIFDVTLSGNATIGNLTLIPEIRLDSYSNDVIIAADGSMKSSLSSFVLAAVYSF